MPIQKVKERMLVVLIFMFHIEEILKFLLLYIPRYFVKKQGLGLPIVEFLQLIKFLGTVIDLSADGMPIGKDKHYVLAVLHEMLCKLLEIILLLRCHDVLAVIKNEK